MSENRDTDFFTHLDWNNTSEELLLSWADIALCYTWIYDKAYRHLDNLNYRFTMPIIVLSTITGTISIGINSLLPSEHVDTGQKIVGAVNLFTGIMTTIQNYRRYAQQVEANLTATNDWARLHRNIRIELSIEREYRKPASDFIKSARQEYERLLNSRPIIESKVIENFRKEIRNSDVIKPEILEKVEHTFLDRPENIIRLYKGFAEKKPTFLSRVRSSMNLNKSNSPNYTPSKNLELPLSSIPENYIPTPTPSSSKNFDFTNIKENSGIITTKIKKISSGDKFKQELLVDDNYLTPNSKLNENNLGIENSTVYKVSSSSTPNREISKKQDENEKKEIINEIQDELNDDIKITIHENNIDD